MNELALKSFFLCVFFFPLSNQLGQRIFFSHITKVIFRGIFSDPGH